MAELILASSSPHRASLLRRLRIPFVVMAPAIDETPHTDELPQALVTRLAFEKAQAVLNRQEDFVVIGSDQVAVCEGKIIGKPGNVENARRQLRSFSGKTVQLLTSVAVLQSTRETVGHAVVETRVAFRQLSDSEIVRYVRLDKPFDCTGSFKAEALGPTLFESVFSQDPTAIVGLPLIETARLLRMAGFNLP